MADLSYDPQQAPADGLAGLLGVPSGPQGLLPIPQQAQTPLPYLGAGLMLPTYGPSVPPAAGDPTAGVSQPPSFLQNIGTWFKHAGQHAAANLVPTPQNDLYSPADLSQARHQAFLQFAAGLAGAPAGRTAGLAGGLASGFQAAQAGGQGALQSILQQRIQGAQVQQYQRVMQARQQIGQQYAISPTDTPVDQLRKAELASQAYALAQDPESAKNMSDIGAALAKEHGIIQVDATDHINLVDGATQQIVGQIPKGVAPQPYEAKLVPPANSLVPFNPNTGGVGKGVGSGSQISPQESITDVTSLGNSYRQNTQDYWTREGVYHALQGAIQSGDDPGTIKMLFAKLINPTRTPGQVTADEIAGMGSLGNRIQNIESQYVNGRWAPGSLQMLKNSADDQMLHYRGSTLAERDQMYGLGVQLGLPPDAVDKALRRPTITLPGDPIPPSAPLRPAPGGGTTTQATPSAAPPQPGAKLATAPRRRAAGGYSPLNPYAPKGQ